MEGAVRNLVQKRCANFANGAFSAKWHDVTRRCGLEADLFSAEWGEPVTPEMVDEALAIGQVRRHDRGPQRDLHRGDVPPGGDRRGDEKVPRGLLHRRHRLLDERGPPRPRARWGPTSAWPGCRRPSGCRRGWRSSPSRRKALEKARTTPNRGYYFDFEEFEKNDAKDNTPSTPCISLIYALDHQLTEDVRRGAGEPLRPPQADGRGDPRLGPGPGLCPLRRGGLPLDDPDLRARTTAAPTWRS